MQPGLPSRGRPFAPPRLEQPVGRDDLVGMQQQESQHRTLPRPAEREHLPTVADLQRAEDTEIHANRILARLRAISHSKGRR